MVANNPSEFVLHIFTKVWNIFHISLSRCEGNAVQTQYSVEVSIILRLIWNTLYEEIYIEVYCSIWIRGIVSDEKAQAISLYLHGTNEKKIVDIHWTLKTNEKYLQNSIRFFIHSFAFSFSYLHYWLYLSFSFSHFHFVQSLAFHYIHCFCVWSIFFFRTLFSHNSIKPNRMKNGKNISRFKSR